MANPVANPGDSFERVSVLCDTVGERKAAPAGNRGLTQQSDSTGKWAGMSVATSDQGSQPYLTIPLVTVATKCGDLGPRYSCNRPEGHTGRHSYVWRNAGELSGRVRAVWGCHGHLLPGMYCAECGSYRGEE
jgi:hypothetical protein